MQSLINFERYSFGDGDDVFGLVGLEGSKGQRSQNIFIRERILPICAFISFYSTILSPKFLSLLTVHNLKANYPNAYCPLLFPFTTPSINPLTSIPRISSLRVPCNSIRLIFCLTYSDLIPLLLEFLRVFINLFKCRV